MNWIKQNKKLAAILGVMIAGVLGLGTWLFFAWSDFSAARGEWDSMSQKTTTMEKNKVYPSAENVKALEQKITDYRDKFVTLRTVLLSPNLQQEVKPVSETEFQARVKERSKFVADKAKDATIGLPKVFALGFEEYSDTLPPSADAAAELNVHLDVMEKLVMSLINARVVSLDDLQRSRVPGEKGYTAIAPPPKTKGPTKAKATTAAAPTFESVLDRYTIKCSFTTDQGPLQAVMNTLSDPAKMPDFLAVRLMRVENEKSEAPNKSDIKNRRPEANRDERPRPGVGTTGSSPVSNVIVPPKPAPPDAVAIIGAEFLKVYLEIDYIRFRPPAEEAAPAPPKR